MFGLVKHKLAPDAGYMSKVPYQAQSKEVSVLCSFWDPVGACGLQTGINGRSREDHGDTKLGSTEECEAAESYFRTHRILQKVYQRLCPNHHAYGEIVEEGCHILLEQRL